MGQTIAEALRAEGLQQGLRQGRQEAALQTAREILIGLLREKFGRVPRALQQQIKVCTDLPRLKAAVYRAGKVHSLDDFQL